MVPVIFAVMIRMDLLPNKVACCAEQQTGLSVEEQDCVLLQALLHPLQMAKMHVQRSLACHRSP